MRRSRALLTLTLALTLTAVPLAAQDFSEVEVEPQKVADGVWMLTGAGGNIGVSAGEDGVFLIDDQFAPLTEKIRAAIATFSEKPIRFVLNTHFHFDHTGGNENLGKAGAVIVAHDNVRERMSVDQLMEALGREVPASPEAALPVITFNDRVTFHLNGDTIKAFHVPPAHTDGDSIVHFEKANVVHMGDVFFNGTYPFVDVGSGGDVEGVIEAVQDVLRHIDEETKIIPGHGPLASKADLAAYGDMLSTIRDRVEALIEEGKSLEEIQEAAPTASFDEAWASDFTGPESITRYVYESLMLDR